MPKNFFQKVSEKMRHGLVLMVLRDRLLRWNIEISPYVWSLESGPESPVPKIEGDFEGFTFGFFGPEDVEKIGSRPTYRNIPVETMKEWLAQGRLCYGCTYKGEVAAFNWVELNEACVKAYPAKMKPNEAYLFDAYTMKPFRGRNIMPYLRVRTHQALKALGRDTCYSLHVTFNKSSQKFKDKINAKPLKTGIYIGLFKKWYWNVTLWEAK